MIYSKNLIPIKSLGLGALLLGLTQTPVMGFNITLDEFSSFNDPENGQFVELSNRSKTNDFSVDEETGLDTSSVFGGERLIRATKQNDLRGGGIIDIFGGQASSSADANSIMRTEIIWDGNDGMATDFTANNQQSIQINISSLNLGGTGSGEDLTLNFELQDTLGETATISQTVNSNLANTDLYFTYGSRDNQNLDMTKIDYVRFHTSSENIGDDFVFNFVRSSDVPFEFSPGLGLLISGGFFSFLIIRSKKANKANKSQQA